MEEELGTKDDPDGDASKIAPILNNFAAKPDLGDKYANEKKEDLYKLLAVKERDLILAAELGKALLEKNEELSKRNEQIAEEYSNKLEVLEQEKYELRRQLEAVEEEYQLRLGELHTDISNLREALETHTTSQKQMEREKSQTVHDLTEENGRLAQELRDAAEKERDLREHIKKMRSQFSKRRNSMQEHFQHVESLRDEIDSVLSKKDELERQIQNLLSERESLTNSLELSSSAILQLERKHRDQESSIRKGEREMDELRNSNLHLMDKLEHLSRSRSSSPSCRMSLQSEMELSGSDSEKSMRRQFEVIDELDELEFDEVDNDDDEDMTCQDGGIWMDELGEEVLSAYSQLRNMCALIRDRERKGRIIDYQDSMDTSSSSVSVHILRSGQLSMVVQEIKGLIHDLIRKERKHMVGEGGCPNCGKTEDQRLQLEKQLHRTREQLDRGSIEMKQAELASKRQEDELQNLRSKLTLLQTRLAAAEDERQVFKADLENITASKDEMIKRAWETRDNAVKRKNSAEVELARSRIDFMQANSQLLEAVQQKVVIAEQLDEWQADLHVVIGQRLTDSETEKTAKAPSPPSEKSGKPELQRKLSITNNKIVSFFQRS